MDSVFNDIEFLMGNMKQETPSTTERAEPLAEVVQNNDTDQLAMSTYMTDFILDYINRSLKVKFHFFFFKFWFLIDLNNFRRR